MENVNRTVVNIYELITCLTSAADLVSPELERHHQQVAYLAYKMGEELNLSRNQQRDLMLAGLLHDVGALSYNERLELIETEPPHAHDHAYKGAQLLEDFEPLKNAAKIIRHHHIPWDHGRGQQWGGEDVSMLSHILHLADRTVVLINHNKEVLGQVKGIMANLAGRKGSYFIPKLLDVLETISVREHLWLDLTDRYLQDIIPSTMLFETLDLNLNEIIDLTKVFASIIDFRSPFTANHTAGVANVAQKLAELAGFSENECKLMLVAGYLHDLGKLAVSNEVLEKPSKLDLAEFNIIRSHTYYTYRLLEPIKAFRTIRIWAAFHHEKLNGNGYPFRLKEESIPLGARIMTVADIFTAITEDRPYRRGMAYEQTLKVLNSLIDNRSICPYVVEKLIENFDEINEIRWEAQREASIKYNYFMDLAMTQ